MIMVGLAWDKKLKSKAKFDSSNSSNNKSDFHPHSINYYYYYYLRKLLHVHNNYADGDYQHRY